MKLNQILNAKIFQIYISSERHWISYERHDDLISNEHGVVDLFVGKIFKSVDFLHEFIITQLFNFLQKM